VSRAFEHFRRTQKVNALMYPVLFKIPQPEATSRLLLFIRPFMMIPLAIFGAFYGMAANVVLFLAWWAILFTAKYPRSMWDFSTRYFRFNTQLNAYSMMLCDVYPPFNGGEDNGYPVRVLFEYPERMSRLHLIFRFLLLLPQFFFAIGYGFVSGFVMFANWWAVLFLGRIPDSFFGWISRYMVWSSRLNAYILLLVDEYPPFHGLQPLSAGDAFE
jgi:hypothetical protein